MDLHDGFLALSKNYAPVSHPQDRAPAREPRLTFDKINTDIAFAQDAQNRLTSVTSVTPLSGSVSQTSTIRAEFFYDPRNRCILRKYYTRGSQSQWVLNTTDSRALTYDSAWNLLTERTLDGKQVGEYIHGLRTDEILRAELTPQTQNPKSQTLYPLADGLGSTVALTDDNGRVTQRYRYTAYGTPTVLTAGYQISNTLISGYRFLFTGREWLSAVDLNDHRNRYYTPGLGRWLSIDLINFLGGRNLYRYSSNAPTVYVDPQGLCCEIEDSELGRIKSAIQTYSDDIRTLMDQNTTLNGLMATLDDRLVTAKQSVAAVTIGTVIVVAAGSGGAISLVFIEGAGETILAEATIGKLVNTSLASGAAIMLLVDQVSSYINNLDLIFHNNYDEMAQQFRNNEDAIDEIQAALRAENDLLHDATMASINCHIRNSIPRPAGCPCQ